MSDQNVPNMASPDEEKEIENESKKAGSRRGSLLDLPTIVQMTMDHERLKFHAGEFHFDGTAEVDRCMSFSFTERGSDGRSQAVEDAVIAATKDSNNSVAATTAVRIWGFWSFLNATAGNVSNITTIATAREANYPTLDILGGPWCFSFCGLRSVIGTAVLVYANGQVTIGQCSVGSLPGFPKAGYGVTGTDTSFVSMRQTVVQRCRHAGARFVRQARAELTDCVFEKCIVQGAKNVWSKRPTERSSPKSAQ
jgi:hypothetical protein